MIGATSLRTNNSPNFGRTEQKKNHKAPMIAMAVGATGVAAVAAYAFRGRIASAAMTGGIGKFFGKVGETLLNWGRKIKHFFTESKMAKGVKKFFGKLFKKKPTTGNAEPKSIGSELAEKAESLKKDMTKLSEELRETFAKEIEKVTSGIRKYKSKEKIKEVLNDIINSAKAKLAELEK